MKIYVLVNIGLGFVASFFYGWVIFIGLLIGSSDDLMLYIRMAAMIASLNILVCVVSHFSKNQFHLPLKNNLKYCVSFILLQLLFAIPFCVVAKFVLT